MTTAEQPPTDPSKVEEIPLEDIDKLLEAEDPEFTKQLEEVRAVENNKDVHIEATIVGDDDPLNPDDKEAVSAYAKFRARLKMSIYTFKHNLKKRLKSLGKDLLIFLKTKPKEFILYSLVMAKVLIKKAMVPLAAFKDFSLLEKLGTLVFLAVLCLSSWVLLNNMKGIWLPLLNEPILTSLANNAEWIEEYDVKEGGESFYSAFPQERHEFLFDRMKVNLRASGENPHPMGAFEVIVLLDSKDTAIEVRDRKVEFFDHLQRVFEDETFADLETEMGKLKLKGRLKRELNQKLTQGWVKDINFQTFILKP